MVCAFVRFDLQCLRPTSLDIQDEGSIKDVLTKDLATQTSAEDKERLANLEKAGLSKSSMATETSCDCQLGEEIKFRASKWKKPWQTEMGIVRDTDACDGKGRVDVQKTGTPMHYMVNLLDETGTDALLVEGCGKSWDFGGHVFKPKKQEKPINPSDQQPGMKFSKTPTVLPNFNLLAPSDEAWLFLCGKGCGDDGIHCCGDEAVSCPGATNASDLQGCANFCRGESQCQGFQAPNEANGFHGMCVWFSSKPDRTSGCQGKGDDAVYVKAGSGLV